MPDFLAAYAEHGTVLAACKQAGIDRSTYYANRDDPTFAAAIKVAEKDAFEVLEAEARRRAVGYMTTKVTRTGEIIEVPAHSDLLMIFLMKHRRPEVFNTKPVDSQPSMPTAEPPRLLITEDLGPREADDE